MMDNSNTRRSPLSFETSPVSEAARRHLHLGSAGLSFEIRQPDFSGLPAFSDFQDDRTRAGTLEPTSDSDSVPEGYATDGHRPAPAAPSKRAAREPERSGHEPKRTAREEVRPWSDAERTLLYLLHNQHLSTNEIAQRLGRTGEAVCNMSRRLGLRRRETAQAWSAGHLRLLKQMLADGSSLKQIADATGHPRSSVADKLRRLNIQSQRFRRPWTDWERETVLALHSTGTSLAAIARALPNRSTDAIQQKLQELVGPSPFRSAHQSGETEQSKEARQSEEKGANRTRTERVPEPRPPTSSGFKSAIVATLPPPPPLRLILERREATPAVIPATPDEMVRWLRSRDFMVLHRATGWQVDRHLIDDPDALLEFVNVRRQRLNLPPFVTPGLSRPQPGRTPPAAALAASPA